MKFIIRDDDVNYFYTPEFLEERYKGIFGICPISVCAVPHVKGDFFKWVYMAEKNKKQFEDKLEQFYDDDEIHSIGDNEELVSALKMWYDQGKVGIAMHGIHHRNWNRNAAKIANNYISGAEMWTEEDRTQNLKDAKNYMENVFGFEVNTFTAPQNMISPMSYKSIRRAGFNLNCDIWPTKDLKKCISIYGLKNYLSLVLDKILSSRMICPKVFEIKGMKVTAVTRIYPTHNLDDIKRNFDYAHKNNGVFVLGTHSYAYDFRMSRYNMSLKEGIIEILNYSQKFDNVDYVTFEELYK